MSVMRVPKASQLIYCEARMLLLYIFKMALCWSINPDTRAAVRARELVLYETFITDSPAR